MSIEAGAGNSAYFSDDDYEAVGATVIPTALEGIPGAAVVASVRPLDPAYAEALDAGAVAVSFLQPGADADTVGYGG